jgi:hypothetical protein
MVERGLLNQQIYFNVIFIEELLVPLQKVFVETLNVFTES